MKPYQMIIPILPAVAFIIGLSLFKIRNHRIANRVEKSVEKILRPGWTIQEVNSFTIKKKSKGMYGVYVEVVNKKLNEMANSHISVDKKGKIIGESLTRGMKFWDKNSDNL